MRVLTISDLHCPYQHPHAIDFLRDLAKEVRPDRVVCLGDEADFYNWSRFDRDPAADAPTTEYTRLQEQLKLVFTLFPKVSCVASNHTLRPWKKAAGCGLLSEFLRTVPDLLGAPKGWSWHDKVLVDNVLYFHGEGFAGRNGAIDAATTYSSSVVIGHLHTHAGIQWRTDPLGGRIFGFNAGCLIDPDALPFGYAKHTKHKPTLGTGIVLDGVPAWVPMEV